MEKRIIDRMIDRINEWLFRRGQNRYLSLPRAVALLAAALWTMALLLCGTALAAPFVDNGNGTVTDTRTGLMWQKGEGGAMTWGSALSYCENLRLPDNSSGYTDWRLPNVKELESITDDSIYKPAIDRSFFPNAYASYYWSSTTYAGYPYGAWRVGFSYGRVDGSYKVNGYYVRCVRGGQGGSFGDLDGDGLPDWWELNHFGDLVQGPNDDYDHDNLNNLREYQLGTNPTRWDTDGDGVNDGTEVAQGKNPLDPNDQETKLPKKFDWRDYASLPPIRDQGSCGACWAFAAIGAVECTYAAKKGGWTDLSEQHLISYCGCPGSCNGGGYRNALLFMRNTGVVDESCFSYKSENCIMLNMCNPKCYCYHDPDPFEKWTCAQPCWCTLCADASKRFTRIKRFVNVQNTERDVKTALIKHGPLAVRTDNWDGKGTNHAFVLVGYDDDKQSWIIRNSHGLSYRDNGYGYISYSGDNASDLINNASYVVLY